MNYQIHELLVEEVTPTRIDEVPQPEVEEEA
jgi:hypothetical protein